MRFLLRPGWLAFIVGVFSFAAACYLLLAPWQFRRNAEREAQNSAISASYTHPPLPWRQLVPPGTAPTPGVEWRQATVTGSYLPAAEAVVRLRTVDGDPAYEVLTPLRATGGEVVLVDRGYIRPQDNNEVPSYAAPPPGQVTVTGRIRPDETDPAHRPVLRQDGHREVYVADSRVVAATTGLSITPGYLQLSGGQPGVLTPLPLPALDAGPFFSYAWQWMIFGVMAVGGLGYFVRLEILRRHGGSSPDAEPAGSASDGEPGAAPPAPAGALLADRYGRRR